MLSPWGQRLRQTLRKLPKARPNRPAKIVAKMRNMRVLSIRSVDEGARLGVCCFPALRQEEGAKRGTVPFSLVLSG